MSKKLFTIDGISIKIDERIFDDFEVNELQIRASRPLPNKDNPDYEQIIAKRSNETLDLIDLILGDQKRIVVNGLREKNNGFVNTETILKWLNKLIEKSSSGKK